MPNCKLSNSASASSTCRVEDTVSECPEVMFILLCCKQEVLFLAFFYVLLYSTVPRHLVWLGMELLTLICPAKKVWCHKIMYSHSLVSHTQFLAHSGQSEVVSFPAHTLHPEHGSLAVSARGRLVWLGVMRNCAWNAALVIFYCYIPRI